MARNFALSRLAAIRSWLAARGPGAWIAVALIGFILVSMVAAVLFAFLVMAVLALVLRPRAVADGEKRPGPLLGPASRAEIRDRGEFDAFFEARARAAKPVGPRAE